MRFSTARGLVVSALLLASMMPLRAETPAKDVEEKYTLGVLEISDPWAKATIGDAHAAQVFFEFRNHGPKADRLLSARASIDAASVQFKLATAPSTSRATQTLSSIEIPVGGPYALSPVGYYIELSALAAPLTMGKAFALELEFAQAGSLTVQVTSRFHSPSLTARIRAAARRGDLKALQNLRDQ